MLLEDLKSVDVDDNKCLYCASFTRKLNATPNINIVTVHRLF